jgi:hypothetical protein
VSTNGRPSGAGKPRIDRLVVLGYVVALGMPPVGLVVGIIGAVRSGRAGSWHALGIILVSIVSAAIWASIIASGGLTATNSSY